MSTAYPLTWPDGWTRTKSPAKSQFKTSLAGAIKNVTGSINAFSNDSDRKIDGFMVSSNVTLFDQSPADAGVAIYFTWDGISTCIAVDRYLKVEENLQAIHHVIEAERTKLRHGGLNLVRAAFRGYAALPPPSAYRRDCWEVLGLKPGAGHDDIDFAYKKLAKALHSDKGGDDKAMADLNAARDKAKGK